MKKILIVAQVLIVLLAAVKVASVLGVFTSFDLSDPDSMMTSQAMAQAKAENDVALKPEPGAEVEKKEPPEYFLTAPVSKDPMEDILAQKRDLAAALTQKKAELDNRENAIRADEQRLIAMRKDIAEKIVILKAQEEKLAARMDEEKEEDIRRYKEMAKVYENTPPNKAGPMMEKLDIKTAAGITMNMKKEKAGALWAFITPQKAVAITRQITRSGGENPK